MKHSHIIVVPGLGGDQLNDRVWSIVKRWQKPNRRVVMFDSRWHTDEPYADKFKRLVELYDQVAVDGRSVYVAGYSAGGALSLALLAARPNMQKVALVSAKLRGVNSIGPAFRRRAPAIVDAVTASEAVLTDIEPDQTARIICYRPVFDGLIPLRDMCVTGARKKLIPFIGHPLAIGFALLFQINRQLR